MGNNFEVKDVSHSSEDMGNNFEVKDVSHSSEDMGNNPEVSVHHTEQTGQPRLRVLF